MPNKMERFTHRARRVLSLAEEAAETARHAAINTGHILIGLLREEEGVAAITLTQMGASLPDITDTVNTLTGEGNKPQGKKLDLGGDIKKMLELAVIEARQLGHHYIGTGHLLLGLSRQSNTIGIKTLEAINIAPEIIQHEIRRLLSETPQRSEDE